MQQLTARCDAPCGVLTNRTRAKGRITALKNALAAAVPRHIWGVVGAIAAAPCGKLIRIGQSRAVPTMSVAPHQAPWRLPLFFLFYSQWQVAWVYKVTAMLWIWGCSLQGG